MSESEKYAFIVNPAAGRGRVQRIEDKLHNLLKRSSLHYLIERTTKPDEAVQLASQLAFDANVVVAVGGDGTVHEVANGLIGRDASLAIVPAGSGNDFARSVHAPQRLDGLIDYLRSGVRRILDTGKVTIQAENSTITNRHFVNTLGVGLDAEIANETRRITWLRGLPLYFLAALRSLRNRRHQRIELTLDGRCSSESSLLVCVGNGTHEGGGFNLTPDAQPDDGVFEICVVRDMPLRRILRILPTALSGRHTRFAEVHMERAAQIRMETESPSIVHADGEILGMEVRKIEISLQQSSLSVVSG